MAEVLEGGVDGDVGDVEGAWGGCGGGAGIVGLDVEVVGCGVRVGGERWCDYGEDGVPFDFCGDFRRL